MRVDKFQAKHLVQVVTGRTEGSFQSRISTLKPGTLSELHDVATDLFHDLQYQASLFKPGSYVQLRWPTAAKQRTVAAAEFSALAARLATQRPGFHPDVHAGPLEVQQVAKETQALFRRYDIIAEGGTRAVPEKANAALQTADELLAALERVPVELEDIARRLPAGSEQRRAVEMAGLVIGQVRNEAPWSAIRRIEAAFAPAHPGR